MKEVDDSRTDVSHVLLLPITVQFLLCVAGEISLDVVTLPGLASSRPARRALPCPACRPRTGPTSDTEFAALLQSSVAENTQWEAEQPSSSAGVVRSVFRRHEARQDGGGG